MNRNSIIAVVIVIIIILGVFIYKQPAIAPATTQTPPKNIAVGEPNPSTPQPYVPPRNDMTDSVVTTTVSYTDIGFSPKDIQIKQGDTVIFVNNSSKAFWPASDNHPDHLIYPEFDPKKSIPVGGEYRFTFEKIGTWKFHNHSKATNVGTVTVSERI